MIHVFVKIRLLDHCPFAVLEVRILLSPNNGLPEHIKLGHERLHLERYLPILCVRVVIDKSLLNATILLVDNLPRGTLIVDTLYYPYISVVLSILQICGLIIDLLLVELKLLFVQLRFFSLGPIILCLINNLDAGCLGIFQIVSRELSILRGILRDVFALRQ